MAKFVNTTIHVRTDGDNTFGGSRDSTSALTSETTGDVSVLESGTANTNAGAKTLTDASATFQTNGVQAGDYVYISAGYVHNIGSFKIASVDSETQLTLVDSIYTQTGQTYKAGFRLTDSNADYSTDGVVAGDIVKINAGTGASTGRYKVAEVIDATNLKLHYDAGDSGGAGDVEYKIGGAVPAIADVWAGAGYDQDIAHPGDIVEIQAGTYNETMTMTQDYRYLASLSEAKIKILANGAVIIDGQSTRANCVDNNTGAYNEYWFGGKTEDMSTDYFECKNATGNGVDLSGGDPNQNINNMKIHNNGGYGIRSSRDGHKIRNCEIYSNSASGIYDVVSSAAGYEVWNCSVHDNAGIGIGIRSEGLIVDGCLLYDNTLDGIYSVYGDSKIRNNTIDGNSRYGISLATQKCFDTEIYNNIISNHSGIGDVGIYGANANTEIGWLDYNCYYNNTSDLSNIDTSKGANAVNADPKFVSTADGSEDFSLEADSPCISAGYPGGGGVIDSEIDIGAYQYPPPTDLPVISNQQLNTYAIDLTGQVIATCDVTNMGANDEVYVEINGKVWKMTTTDNVNYTITIQGYDIGECSAATVKFIANSSTLGSDEENASDTLTVSNTGTAYTILKNKLIAKLNGIGKLQEVVDSWEHKFTGYPAANVVPVEGEADYETTAENERVYNFQINLYYGNDDVDNAKDALLDLVDDVLDELDKDQTLTGITLPSAYAMIAVDPTFAGWEEVESRKYLLAVINVRIRVSVDII